LTFPVCKLTASYGAVGATYVTVPEIKFNPNPNPNPKSNVCKMTQN